MGIKLTLVVTHYKEPLSVYRWIFDSIRMQQGIDFNEIEIIVIEDSTDKADFIPEGFLNSLEIHYLVAESNHGGISKARNLGIALANGDYVEFCDCDDMFHSSFGIHMLFEKMKNAPDLITSIFIEEVKNGDAYNLIRRERDCTFVHGKAFKKAFLDEHNIRFDDALTIHEDGYFLGLFNSMCEKAEYIENPFYLWKWNSNSVVRTDSKDFLLKTYKNLIDAREHLAQQFVSRGMEDKLPHLVTKVVMDVYYDFQKDAIFGADKTLVRNAMMDFKRFYTKWHPYFDKCDKQTIAAVAMFSRNVAIKNGLLLEKMSLKDFLKGIMSMK